MSGRNTQIAADRQKRLADLLAGPTPKRRAALQALDFPVRPSPSSDWGGGSSSLGEPSSSPEGETTEVLDSEATFENESGKVILSESVIGFDMKEAQADMIRLWLLSSPEMCLKVLATVKYTQDGWCKLASKRGNQGGYVRISCLGEGGHDVVEVRSVGYLVLRYLTHRSLSRCITWLSGRTDDTMKTIRSTLRISVGIRLALMISIWYGSHTPRIFLGLAVRSGWIPWLAMSVSMLGTRRLGYVHMISRVGIA